MAKKLFVNERQYRKLLELIKEEMGIADEVTRISKDIERRFFAEVGDMTENKSGAFYVDDLKVVWKLLVFDNSETFSDWYSVNYKEYKNGYSRDENTLYMTIIKTGGEVNINDILDTIQHEVEHYYQIKMKNGSLSTDKYQTAVSHFRSHNMYLSNFSKLIYFSKRFEIDAYVNGAYNAASNGDVSTYEEFVQSTELKNLLSTIQTNKKFFTNAPFDTPEFYTLVGFIRKEEFFNFKDEKDLRRKLLEICDETYDYFLKKSARAWTLLDRKNKGIAEGIIENKLIKQNHLKGKI